MRNFDEYLYKYGLHDCTIDNIFLQDNVEFNVFTNTVKENKLDIEINYFSPFANEILLIGYMKPGKYEIRLSEISNIYFSFLAG